jgi:poly(ADP-ribose) glycohydrolase
MVVWFSHLYLLRTLLSDSKNCQEHKVKCLVHYFERICKDTPNGLVSFERKLLPFKSSSHSRGVSISYPEADFWSNSASSLCPFKVKFLNLFLYAFCSFPVIVLCLNKLESIFF